jgi:hypothetical protein
MRQLSGSEIRMQGLASQPALAPQQGSLNQRLAASGTASYRHARVILRSRFRGGSLNQQSRGHARWQSQGLIYVVLAALLPRPRVPVESHASVNTFRPKQAPNFDLAFRRQLHLKPAAITPSKCGTTIHPTVRGVNGIRRFANGSAHRDVGTSLRCRSPAAGDPAAATVPASSGWHQDLGSRQQPARARRR